MTEEWIPTALKSFSITTKKSQFMSIFFIFGEILPLANQEIQVLLILHKNK